MKIAERYGIEAAILIENLYFWIRRNECNDEYFRDGRFWCYSTFKGFNRYLPYMNPQKIRRELVSLESKGIILTGNYNKSSINHTLWYAFTDNFMNEMECLGYDFSKMKNRIFKNEKSIEDNIIEDNSISHIGLSELNSSKQQYESDSLFLEFWSKYKKAVDKKKAFTAFKNLSKKDKLAAIACIEPYREARNQDNKYIKNPSTYLHDRTWENDFDDYNHKIAFYDPIDGEPVMKTKYKAWMRTTYPEIENTALPLSYEDYMSIINDSDVETVSQYLEEINSDIYKYRRSDIASVLRQRISDGL